MYKEIWDPSLRDILLCARESSNPSLFLYGKTVIVGLVPRKISIILNKKWLFNYLPSYSTQVISHKMALKFQQSWLMFMILFTPVLANLLQLV